MVSILIHPGWSDSGPTHWQTLWCAKPNTTRVVQKDWIKVELEDWLATLDRYIDAAKAPVILVAHSLSTILVAHWAARHPSSKVRAALLVAPTDVERRVTCPPETWGFAPIPRQRLPFRSIVVGSADDPYTDATVAESLARSWGSEFVNIGQAGHINTTAGYGLWPEGEDLLERLIQEVEGSAAQAK